MEVTEIRWKDYSSLVSANREQKDAQQGCPSRLACTGIEKPGLLPSQKLPRVHNLIKKLLSELAERGWEDNSNRKKRQRRNFGLIKRGKSQGKISELRSVKDQTLLQLLLSLRHGGVRDLRRD